MPNPDDVDDVVDEGADDAADGNAPDDADEGADDDAADDNAPDDVTASAKSRSEGRVARLAREAREAREKAARMEGELNAYKARQQPALNTTDAERIRREKLELMTPEERERFLDREKIHKLESEAIKTQLLVQDSSDKNDFNMFAAKNSTAAKYKARVEETLADMRRNGTNAPRMTVYKYLLGEDVVKASENPGTKKKLAAKKAAATQRTTQAQGKATSARGDVGGGGKGGDSLAALKARILQREARGDIG